jgi:hypothetical protein
MKRLLIVVACLSLVSGCASYGNGEEPECYSLADCNPGKECGLMVKCVDKKCQAGQTIDLPCEQACTQDTDCPEDMHCRIEAGGGGECVADGTCVDVSECLGLPHYTCVGDFECVNGMCNYNCEDLTSCNQDADCVLADKDCCCGSTADDYIAVRQDKLSEWISREECALVDCPEIACVLPEGLSAVCVNSECTTELEGDWYSCQEDSDCVKVDGFCCGCENGSLEAAVNRDYQAAYERDLADFCARADYMCPLYNACTDWPAVCDQGKCKTLREKCNCGDEWDPVCNGTGAKWTVFGSECEAECVDLDWHYHGRCECQMDCGAGPCFRGWCATNDQTYYCGAGEAECNGQQIKYQGACEPDCEICLMLGRPSIPVCDQDFCDQSDMCLAECHDLDWWHEGLCLEGEGAVCGGSEGIACLSDDLFCLIEEPMPGATGACIVLGQCLQASDCNTQPLAHDECEGYWTCSGHACIWECD